MGPHQVTGQVEAFRVEPELESSTQGRAFERLVQKPENLVSRRQRRLR